MTNKIDITTGSDSFSDTLDDRVFKKTYTLWHGDTHPLSQSSINLLLVNYECKVRLCNRFQTSISLYLMSLNPWWNLCAVILLLFQVILFACNKNDNQTKICGCNICAYFQILYRLCAFYLVFIWPLVFWLVFRVMTSLVSFSTLFHRELYCIINSNDVQLTYSH